MNRAIAAIDDKRGLSTDKGIPWDVPADRTYLELSKPMAGCRNFVAVHGDVALRDGFEPVSDVADFLQTASQDVWVIGGAGLFTQAWPYIGELYLTRITGDYNCTKFLPAFTDAFERVYASEPQRDNGIDFTYEHWRRRAATPIPK